MTYQQFLNWMAYDQVEPFGEERADVRTGVAFAKLASVVVGSSGAKLKGKKGFLPQDFMWRPPGPREAVKLSDEEKATRADANWRNLKAAFVAMGEQRNRAKGLKVVGDN